MPAYNEAAVLSSVLSDVCSAVPARRVVVVNDGSCDATGVIAAKHGVHVVHHELNRGLGAALKSGMILAVALGAQAVVTFDADGQHKAQHVDQMIAPLLRGEADMVIGSRFLKNESMPRHRRAFNAIGNVVTWLFHGAWTSDSQSGLRAFNLHALTNLDIRANQMDVSSEFIKEAHRLRLRVAEVPIPPIYTEYSMSKGQSFMGGIRTVSKIAIRKFLH